MSSDWITTTLDRIGKIVTGKTPPTINPEYYGGEVPFITPSDLDGRRIIESTGRYLTKSGTSTVSGAILPPMSVMVSCIGSDMGKAALNAETAVTNQQINSIIVNKENDPLFIYYSLLPRKSEIRSAASGSAQPILNKSAFGRMEIILPPRVKQRAIGKVLGTLDDKIELNRKMNETLEAMARATFKSWFIDFDEIPADYTEVKIGDICRLEYGKNLPTTNLIDHGFPVYGAGGVIGYYNKSLYSDPTILITCRGNGSGHIHETREEAFVTNNSIAIIPISAALSRHYVRHSLLSLDRSTVVTGSAQPQITVTNLQTLIIRMPKEQKVIQRFHDLVEPLWRRCLENDLETKVLAKMRDALLPKLIAGEIDVSQVSAVLDEVAI